MPIVAYFSGDVQSYVAQGKWQPALPEVCPVCGSRDTLVGHGSYGRYVAEEQPTLRLRILRCRCRACGHTLGVLPSFLVPHRHYSAGLIQMVLALRHQARLSRRQLGARFQGVPALSTCLAWLRAFGANAQLWLKSLLATLTRLDPGNDPLHKLVSPVGLAHGPPRLLLELIPDLVTALGMDRPELGVSLARGLGLLVLWGQRQRLPRLI